MRFILNLIALPFRHPLKFVGIVAFSTIAVALAIEAAGYLPCTLCLYQRIPYYSLLGAMLAFGSMGNKMSPAWITKPFHVLVLAILIASFGLGTYHAGVEFGWWSGPSGCSGKIDTSDMNNLIASLQQIQVVSCTKASFWIFGLSLSVWNAIISAGLAIVVATGLVSNKPFQK